MLWIGFEPGIATRKTAMLDRTIQLFCYCFYTTFAIILTEFRKIIEVRN
jgi:hypothetical protein